ncbi:MAG TPA: zf-TFIIB domain-containing protein [Verrucomicrobiae bacterium]|nr:zf-TFIIB domain-containing protein [Verrucomicrobiae bacterium]
MMNCPRCNSILCTIDDSGVQVEVCPDCKGEWLPAGELEKLVEHHERKFTPEEIASLDAVNKEHFTPAECDHDELHCPQCVTVEMTHFNYGDTSGIILDKCPTCGGIWTDKGQLEKVEELVDGWKSHLGEDMEKYGPVLEKVEVEEQKELDKVVSISRFGFVNAVLRKLCEGFASS